MGKIWGEVLYFLKQKSFLALVGITAVAGYGFAITHESIGVDDTMVEMYLEEGLEAYMGRWTIYLLNKLFRISSFSPFITEWGGLMLLFMGVLLFCVLLRRIFGDGIGMPGYIVFACVFLSCPFISEVWVYYYHDGVDLGYVLLALSLLLLMSGLEKKGKSRVKELLGSVFLLCAAVGCYEPFLILYIIGFLVILFFRGMTGTEEMKLHIIGKLFLCACLVLGCIVLRTVIQKAVIVVFSLQDLGEIVRSREVADSLKIFGKENWISILFMLVKRYCLVYFVNATLYFPIAVYVASLVLFGVTAVVFAIKRKSGWYLLLFAGMAIVPMTLSIMVGVAPLYRQCQFIPFFTASAALLPYLFLKKYWKKYGGAVFALAAACLVWNQAYESNYIFYTDYLKYQHDREMLTGIAREVAEKYGSSARVIFTGSYRAPYNLVKKYYVGYFSKEFQRISALTDWLDPHLKEKNYTPYGYSFAGEAQYSVIEWGLYAFDSPGRELGRFLEMHGYSLQVETDRELLDKAEDFAEGMPSWPQAGSVAEMDGYVIVHF